MATVYLALGSNVGKGDQQFNQAITLLGEQLRDIVEAPRYISRAVGYEDQADFINTVIQASTGLSPRELLAFTQTIEHTVGRIRRFRWGPREIDIDIIFYDELVISEPELVIPHPRFAERDFVLKPLVDLNPNLTDPTSHLSVSELYNKLPANIRAIKD
ncbi:2-amino-4-hydroxy-6-hydroxymethyldihydropteridine diphosphokinase [Patescibacteria group bacterium]|nr:MAG: 2-amino-4-hydroxy-6-hydroxymethyldihydropteridine diphosphokinase [Patescibacteria group bacterium]